VDVYDSARLGDCKIGKDLYFREVVIDLDAGTELALNSRVQAHIQVTRIEARR